MKKKIIMVSHGKLSEGMHHSLEMIAGKNDDLLHLGMMPGQHFSEVSDIIAKMAKENPDVQYIVIADLFGGSVCNGCMPLTLMKNVKLISGLNMGMVIEFLFAQAPLNDEMVAKIVEQSKKGILQITPDMVQGNEEEEEDFF